MTDNPRGKRYTSAQKNKAIRIFEKARKAGFSGEEAAERANVSQATYYRWRSSTGQASSLDWVSAVIADLCFEDLDEKRVRESGLTIRHLAHQPFESNFSTGLSAILPVRILE